MIIDPAAAHPTAIYHAMIGVILPRPIAWVSTLSPGGVANLAPFSYFTGVGLRPPSLCFSVLNRRDGSAKDTILNLRARPEFVVNVVPDGMGGAMNATSAGLAYEESEFAAAQVESAPSARVAPPRVKGSPVHMECALDQIVAVGEGPLAGNLVIGRILLIEIDDAVLGEDGQPDPRKLDLIGRMGGADTYVRTTDLFTLGRPA